MATCVGCQQSHFGIFQLKAGFCEECRNKREASASAKAEKRAAVSSKTNIEDILLTTENDPQGLLIEERLGIISAECAFGMHVFKDLFAGVRDIVGGRSAAVQDTLRDSREVVLHELRMEAAQVGADSVIAVDFEYVDLSTSGNMVLLVANGTAVRTRVQST
ncbi:YbjQ family protein [Octadecabacter sp. CECT 8868]|uniref:YbjQ family protein n=1 Tax=Octadecabacter algicola TaxID=2909342 RepID=UPI001F2AB46B|nr:YbjQ family protein [Octadecabacter algicola]MCF2905492.1 YbjQ family protein [Octadecabacter algicola]